ncbi:MAG: EscU/YscU/HrcU family type III secretion system export apparatus switch protein [Candidatus Latescibacteria bacterium]|nr:EscU/YscU/HrcU family type III secretion system export apparatus switch protein [Candidatus Latescibacterota bacterium]
MKPRKSKRIPDRPAAAALRYRRDDDSAPRLVAKGMGKLAERIVEAAKKAGVPIHEDPDLLALLMALDIDEVIPPEMYVAVAEVLAFVYHVNGRAAGSFGR